MVLEESTGMECETMREYGRAERVCASVDLDEGVGVVGLRLLIKYMACVGVVVVGMLLKIEIQMQSYGRREAWRGWWIVEEVQDSCATADA
jgi:hypothetical protein